MSWVSTIVKFDNHKTKDGEDEKKQILQSQTQHRMYLQNNFISDSAYFVHMMQNISMDKTLALHGGLC